MLDWSGKLKCSYEYAFLYILKMQSKEAFKYALHIIKKLDA